MVIVHNKIHEILVDMSFEPGWDEESQIFHLCGFLDWIRRNGPLHELTQPALEEKFRAYLQAVADKENDGEPLAGTET